jgi:hypothetical protein
MSIVKKLLLILFVVGIASAKVSGQAARSPFTTFGVGEPYGNGLINNQGMGGIGVSLPQFWYVNNSNPALLVYNMNTVFQAGIVGERRTIKGDSLSQKNASGNLNYLVTAFNLSKKPGRWSTSIGLMPYTAVNYEMSYFEQALDNDGNVIDTANVIESGTGGLTQFYWSHGVRINRHFSVGGKLAYLFGPIETVYSSVVYDPDQLFPYAVNVKEKTKMKGLQFTLGAHYLKDSLGHRHDRFVSLGAVYSLGSDLRSSRRAEISRTRSNGDAIDSDTLFQTRGNVFIPGAMTFGISFAKRNVWSIGTEFSFQDWTAFSSSINKNDEGLGKSWRIGIGGEITPDAISVSNYLKRVTYRLGLSYERLPFLIDNNVDGDAPNLNTMNDLSVSGGFSLPVRGSSLDFAVKYGKRGNREETLFEETYLKIYFGLTFNDTWFIKRKFD